VLATSYEEGCRIDSPEVAGWSQARRNALAEAGIDLYFRELFEFHAMQTDPHFGNYRVRAGREGRPDQLILLDFGAVREFPETFLRPYFEMVEGAFRHDPAQVARGAEALGFMREEDSPALRQAFADLCFLITEPFATPGADPVAPGTPPCIRRDLFDAEGRYDWGASDLPKRAAIAGKDLAFRFRLRPPPREVVFLDRKMGGVFIVAARLGARLRGRERLAERFASLRAGARR
jgi:hypothetical protein